MGGCCDAVVRVAEDETPSVLVAAKDVGAADHAVYRLSIAFPGLVLKINQYGQILAYPGGYRLKSYRPAARESAGSPFQPRSKLVPTVVDTAPSPHDRYVVPG